MAPKRKRDEMTGPPRKSYTAEHKLEVVAYAKEHGNRAAGRQYGVGETSVREWKKSEEELNMLQPRTAAVRITGMGPVKNKCSRFWNFFGKVTQKRTLALMVSRMMMMMMMMRNIRTIKLSK